MSRERQPGEGHIAASNIGFSATGGNRTSYRTRNLSRNGCNGRNVYNGMIAATPEFASDRNGWGKFTLAIDCDGLLMPDVSRTGIFVSKSAEDAAQFFYLSTILTIEFDEGSCLRTLTSLGDWFVTQYREMDKPARYETWTNGREGDWSDPDMVLIVRVEEH